MARGLIERVADEQQVLDKRGQVQIVPGASDKRLLLRLPELSRCFKVQRRENATLSEYLREAWDGGAIHVPNRSSNALSASDYALALVGDITPGALNKLLSVGTEAFDGFANRFLWCLVQGQEDLPDGGNVEVLTPFLERLRAALAFGKQAGELRRDAGAEALWHAVYGDLRRSGDAVPHTDRARAQVLRLSLLYALADCSRVIAKAHLYMNPVKLSHLSSLPHGTWFRSALNHAFDLVPHRLEVTETGSERGLEVGQRLE